MKILVFLFPILIFLIMLSIKIGFPAGYLWLIQEDSILENMQFWIYLAASVFSFFVAARFLGNKSPLLGTLYGLLALGLLFASLEEISWGQRFFNISSPGFFERYNTQKEMTFHNLYGAQGLLHKGYILVGAYGAFAWIFASPFKSKAKKQRREILDFVVPEWFTSSYFIFVFLLYVVFEFVAQPKPGDFLNGRDQEPVELLLSLGFLAFAATNYVRARVKT